MIEPVFNFSPNFSDPSLKNEVASHFAFEKVELPFVLNIIIDIKKIVSQSKDKVALSAKVFMIHDDFRVDVISESFSLACIQAREIINIKLSKELRFNKFMNLSKTSAHQAEV